MALLFSSFCSPPIFWNSCICTFIFFTIYDFSLFTIPFHPSPSTGIEWLEKSAFLFLHFFSFRSHSLFKTSAFVHPIYIVPVEAFPASQPRTPLSLVIFRTVTIFSPQPCLEHGQLLVCFLRFDFLFSFLLYAVIPRFRFFYECLMPRFGFFRHNPITGSRSVLFARLS